MEKDNIKTVDLFSGCDEMLLGFQNAGFEIATAFDNWKLAVEVYKENFDHSIYDYDLSNEESKEFIKGLSPNLIIGGLPCQDFSSAGKRDDTLGRADLTISYAEIVSIVKPQYFVMENVEGIKKSRILKDAIKILKSAGYGITMDVFNASYCGVPQARKRFFMVGSLGETDEFLLPYFSKNLSKEQVTICDYFGDSLGIEHYYQHPRSYKRCGVFSIHEPSPTIRSVNSPIPAGYLKHSGDTADVSENVCSLTTIERSYIQTFPEMFIFNGSKTNLEQIIGNAVPVKLGEFVANSLVEYIEDKKENKQKHNAPLRLAMEPETKYKNTVFNTVYSAYSLYGTATHHIQTVSNNLKYARNMPECKLCLKNKELKRSHIILEFMYSGIYDKEPKRFYEIKHKDKEAKIRIEQKGKREYLLCGECETKLSKYEKYADEIIYGKNNNREAVLVNQSMTPNGRGFLYEFEGVKYKSMKLFLDSLLWRLLVSKTIVTPKYSRELKEKLRLLVYDETPLGKDENPLGKDENPCLIYSIMAASEKILKGFILLPIEKKGEDRTILSILIDGFEYNFYISGLLPNNEINPFLQKNREFKIIGRLIYDMSELIEVVKERMDPLRDRLKNKKNFNEHNS